MIRMRRRERILLMLTVALAVLFVVQAGIIRPAVSRIRRLSTRVRITAQDLSRMRGIVNKKAQVQANYEEIRQRITSSKNPQQEVIDMLLTVEKAAQDSGVEILENGYLSDKPFEYFTQHTLRFQGRGKSEALVRMIHALQQPDLLLKIPEMKFAVKNHQLEMDLRITRIVSKASANE